MTIMNLIFIYLSKKGEDDYCRGALVRKNMVFTGV